MYFWSIYWCVILLGFYLEIAYEDPIISIIFLMDSALKKMIKTSRNTITPYTTQKLGSIKFVQCFSKMSLILTKDEFIC